MLTCYIVSMETISNKNIIQLFKEFYEKQEEIERLTSASSLNEYSHTELHSLDYIGSTEYANVSAIAKNLNITRGAASKITRRLIGKENIVKFQTEDNKKEVYFKLAPKGVKIFNAHRERHAIWVNNDLQFLKTVKSEDKAVIHNFLSSFNEYLDVLIEKEREEV